MTVNLSNKGLKEIANSFDMFYIDIWEGYLPSFLPFIGDSYLSLLTVFNFADSYIFIGVAILVIFQKDFILNNQIK